MRLAAIARRDNLCLTVADVFQYSALQDMASVVSTFGEPMEDVQPFSLIPEPILEEIHQAVCTQCRINRPMIKDIYPCTRLQADLMALSIKYRRLYVAYDFFELPTSLSIVKFQNACNHLVQRNQILRTRINHFKSTMYQTVVHENTSWMESTDLESYLKEQSAVSRQLGDSLCQFGLIKDRSGKKFFVWTIHHSLQDGWSRDILLEELGQLYNNSIPALAMGYNRFIKYLQDESNNDWRAFWNSRLADLEPRLFPSLPSTGYRPRPDASFERFFK